ncbi:MAG: hypothetical protein ACJ8FY_18975 [Gemmataceae bacterium]
MLSIGLLSALLLAMSTADVASNSVEDLLARAEQALNVGIEARDNPRLARAHFREAARLYEDLYHLGHHNAACLRNEGNAALLADDLPRAILAYRRGLRLSPNDRVLRSNLAFAREQVDYSTADPLGRPPSDSWPAGLPRPETGWLLASAAVLYTLGCLAMTLFWMTRKAVLLSIILVLFSLTAVPISGLALHLRSESYESNYPLVVVSENGVLLRAGNSLAYPARYETPLNRGVEARLLFMRGNWAQIELAAGETGWVNIDYLLIDKS